MEWHHHLPKIQGADLGT